MKLKKVIAAAMAATIVACPSFTAFAAEGTTINVSEPATSPVEIKTPAQQQHYTVTIPAETQIKWGDTEAYTLEAKATGLLNNGNELTVEVNVGDAKLAHNTHPDEVFLACTMDTKVNNASATSFVMTGNVPTATAQTTMVTTIKVNDGEFEKAPAGEYSKVLTYTATLNSQP